MNTDKIFDAIEEIASDPSKNAKQALVAKYGQSNEFKEVLKAALNPLITYGIAKVPDRTNPSPEGVSDFGIEVWGMIEYLAARDLTGTLARDRLADHMNELSAKSAELLKRIIKKDLRAGFSESTVNKAFKGLIPDFPYMRCCLPKDAKLEEWDWKAGVISQEKADGMFANIDHESSGLVRITSRQGSAFPIEWFSTLVAEIRERLSSGMQYHGELLVMRDDEMLERAIGNGILNSVLKGGGFGAGERPVYKVWDAIPLEDVKPKHTYAIKYSDRLRRLITDLNANAGKHIFLIETKIVRSISEAYEHYRGFLKANKEGTVIKNPIAVWRDGTSKHQVKLKLEADCDLKIIAIVPGKDDGKNEGRAGSLTCVTSCGQLQVDVTVKNEKMRDHIDANPEDWIDRIVSVRSNAILNPSESNDSHSLFLPRLVEADYRLDKNEPDSLQRVRDQFEAAIKAA